MTKPSLTPHTDAALKAIEQGRDRAAAQFSSPDPHVARVARIRTEAGVQLVLAMAREMDSGADAHDVYLAVVAAFANLAITAGAMRCSDTSELRAAGIGLLIHAGQVLAEEWSPPAETDVVRVADPGPAGKQ